jgi:hypothetical protein
MHKMMWATQKWFCARLYVHFFVGLVYKGKYIVFRFIIEYSSLGDFGPLVDLGLFLNEDFWKMIFWLVYIVKVYPYLREGNCFETVIN